MKLLFASRHKSYFIYFLIFKGLVRLPFHQFCVTKLVGSTEVCQIVNLILLGRTSQGPKELALQFLHGEEEFFPRLFQITFESEE